MMNTYETENTLAMARGWTPVKDVNRHPAPDAHWCKFERDGEVVWCVYPVWTRATKTPDGRCVDHTRYNSLGEALEGAGNV